MSNRSYLIKDLIDYHFDVDVLESSNCTSFYHSTVHSERYQNENQKLKVFFFLKPKAYNQFFIE
jgi:hypothetical protein